MPTYCLRILLQSNVDNEVPQLPKTRSRFLRLHPMRAKSLGIHSTPKSQEIKRQCSIDNVYIPGVQYAELTPPPPFPPNK